MEWIIRLVVNIVLMLVLSALDAVILGWLAGSVNQIPVLDTYTFGTWFVLNLMLLMPLGTALALHRASQEWD